MKPLDSSAGCVIGHRPEAPRTDLVHALGFATIAPFSDPCFHCQKQPPVKKKKKKGYT
jgi:hypothetical protein